MLLFIFALLRFSIEEEDSQVSSSDDDFSSSIDQIETISSDNDISSLIDDTNQFSSDSEASIDETVSSSEVPDIPTSYCVCKTVEQCQKCPPQSLEISYLINDPGDLLDIYIYTSLSVSSSIFKYDHKINVSANIYITDVEEIVFEDNKYHINKLEIKHEDFNYITIRPKSDKLDLNFESDKLTEIKFDINGPLNINFTTKDTSSNVFPYLEFYGKGEVNFQNYPHLKVFSYSKYVFLYNGAILICNNAATDDFCQKDEIDGYKVKGTVSLSELKILDRFCKVYFDLASFASEDYIDIKISELNDNGIFLYNATSLPPKPKIRITDAKTIEIENGYIILSSQYGKTFMHQPYDNLIISFEETLAINNNLLYPEYQLPISIQPTINWSMINFPSDDKYSDYISFKLEAINDLTVFYTGSPQINNIETKKVNFNEFKRTPTCSASPRQSRSPTQSPNPTMTPRATWSNDYPNNPDHPNNPDYENRGQKRKVKTADIVCIVLTCLIVCGAVAAIVVLYQKKKIKIDNENKMEKSEDNAKNENSDDSLNENKDDTPLDGTDNNNENKHNP